MTRVRDAIVAVFPDFDPATFSEDMEMLSIPGWDSMTSVNLQMQLQTVFEVPFESFVMGDETRVSEIAAFLKSKKVKLAGL